MPISLWILVGSILGGLLLLALIIFCLWKVRAGLGSALGGAHSRGQGALPAIPTLPSLLSLSPQLGFFTRKKLPEEEKEEEKEQ